MPALLIETCIDTCDSRPLAQRHTHRRSVNTSAMSVIHGASVRTHTRRHITTAAPCDAALISPAPGLLLPLTASALRLQRERSNRVWSPPTSPPLLSGYKRQYAATLNPVQPRWVRVIKPGRCFPSSVLGGYSSFEPYMKPRSQCLVRGIHKPRGIH